MAAKPNEPTKVETETRVSHTYEFHGKTVEGYGPSMDPHLCGDPDEPCRTVTEARTVTPWQVVSEVVLPPGGESDD